MLLNESTSKRMVWIVDVSDGTASGFVYGDANVLAGAALPGREPRLPDLTPGVCQQYIAEERPRQYWKSKFERRR